MRLENAKAIIELDIEGVFPAHISDILNRRIFRGSKWHLSVLSRFQNRPSSRSSLIRSTIFLSIFVTSIGSIVSKFTRRGFRFRWKVSCHNQVDHRGSYRVPRKTESKRQMRQTFPFADGSLFLLSIFRFKSYGSVRHETDGHENTKQNENHENKDAELPDKCRVSILVALRLSFIVRSLSGPRSIVSSTGTPTA
jgi:hypothetical protein